MLHKCSTNLNYQSSPFCCNNKSSKKRFIGLEGDKIDTDYWKKYISTVATSHGKNALFGFFRYSLFILGARHSFTTSQKKTFFVSFFFLFLIERCNIKLWKSSLKLIHLKYFLKKFIQLHQLSLIHSVFLKWWNISKSVYNVFHLYLMRELINCLCAAILACNRTHIAHISHISENFSAPVCT